MEMKKIICNKIFYFCSGYQVVHYPLTNQTLDEDYSPEDDDKYDELTASQTHLDDIKGIGM